MSQTILQQFDIDRYIVTFLDIESLVNLSKINKYYYGYINNFQLVKEYKIYLSQTQDIIMNNLTDTFCLVCSLGLINYAKYLCKNNDIDICNNTGFFLGACKSGNLELVKWIFLDNLIKNDNKIDINYNYALYNACLSGKLETVIWIIEYRKLDCQIFINSDTFRECFYNGNFVVAKWLIDKSYETTLPLDLGRIFVYKSGIYDFNNWLLNIESCIDFLIHLSKYANKTGQTFGFQTLVTMLFKEVCKRGNLNKAQVFYSSEVNEYIKKDEISNIFMRCCKLGQLMIAQWLKEIAIDNNKINRKQICKAFKSACHHNRINIAKWLCTLDKRLYIHIKDDIIITEFFNLK